MRKLVTSVVSSVVSDVVGDPDPAVVAQTMWAADRASHALGMMLEEVRTHYARMSMVVRPDMVNGLGICHGGLVFTLADSAMAFASNSQNQSAVAATAHIDWLSPAREGERLVAVATEHWNGGRTGLSDVMVTADDGRRVAIFHGRTSRTGATIVRPED